MPVFLGYAPSDDPADNCCSVSLSPRLGSLVYCEASCRLDLTPCACIHHERPPAGEGLYGIKLVELKGYGNMGTCHLSRKNTSGARSLIQILQ
ncbi:uncharacterized protein An01g14570 [Aspergillus niger]|uniref:Contig An01c0470, genomic contig n=2 Tax=Aspergillus niger TaxID=5061 RepID=A2QBA7_ASPNC|nr:uncharacterized protein An01g14570 [Aspergillus niger]CAK44155.1 unnamed protein product [Aspergillus niger]